MADRLAYIKFFFENRIAIIGIMVSLGGYNGFQFWEKSEKDIAITSMSNKLTELTRVMSNPIVVQQSSKDWSKYIKEQINKHDLIHKGEFH